MRHYSNQPSQDNDPIADQVPESSSDGATLSVHELVDTAADTASDVLDEDDEGTGYYVEGDNIMYSTGEVAKHLHISRDMARIYIKEFEEFLHVSKSREGRYGHLCVRSTDMDVLEHIVKLRKNRHSVEYVKQVLKDPYLAAKLNVQTADYTELLGEMFTRSNAALLSEFQNMMDRANEQSRLLLESNSHKDEQIEELSGQLKDLQDIVSKQSDTLLEQADAMADQYDVIKEQTAAIESLRALLEEQTSNKKKGFFGLFK